MNSIIFYSVKILNLVQKLLLSKYYSNHVNVLKFRNLMTSKTKLYLSIMQIYKDHRKGILRSSLKHTNHYLYAVIVNTN
jgi:hypothetical protein